MQHNNIVYGVCFCANVSNTRSLTIMARTKVIPRLIQGDASSNASSSEKKTKLSKSSVTGDVSSRIATSSIDSSTTFTLQVDDYVWILETWRSVCISLPMLALFQSI